MKKVLSFFMLVPLLLGNAYSQKDQIDDSIYDALKYVISIDSINTTAKTIYANTVIRTQAVAGDLDVVMYDLIDLNVDSVFVNGQMCSFTMTDSSVIVPFVLPMSTGDVFETHIYYHGTPFSESWGGVVFNGEYVYNLGVGISTVPHNLGKAWFPCFDNFTDKAAFEYFITVPNNKKVAAGGVLKEIIYNDDNTQTYHYDTDYELATYAASFALGEYEVVEDIHHGVNGDIPITYTVRSSAVNAIPIMFANIHTIIDFYEEKFGPYPFERIGYTGTSIGAMEHQNNIAFPNSCFSSNLDYESLYAHELFHSWFGNYITCKTAEDMWINEGWATFMQYYYQIPIYGEDAYMSDILSAKSTVIASAHSNSQDGGYFPLNKIPQSNTYGVSAYERGALVVHSLKNYLGDELFFSSVKKVLQKNSYSSMSSEEFNAALNEASGVNLDGFFNNFVYQGGASAYVIDSCFYENHGGKSWTTRVYLQQKLKARTQYTDGNKVSVTFMDANLNKDTKTMYFDGRYGNMILKSSVEPVMAFVNYYDEIYDARYSKEKITSSTGMLSLIPTMFKVNVLAISDSAFVRVNKYLVAPNDSSRIDKYRLSSNNFWTVDLIPYGEFSAQGFFNYSKNTLDADLLEDPDAELRLVYRPDPFSDWQVLETTQVGAHSIGDLVLDSLMTGIYCLAVYDSTISAIPSYTETELEKSYFSLYPNPSNDDFIVDFEPDEFNDRLVVYDINMRKVFERKLSPTDETISWKPAAGYRNTYLFVLENRHRGNSLKKAVYLGR